MTNKDKLLSHLKKVQCHKGTKTSNYNPQTSRFIKNISNNHAIIDLNKTINHLKKAMSFLKHVIKNDTSQQQSILFLGTNRAHSTIVKLLSFKTKQAYVCKKWTPGLLSNWEQNYQQITAFNKFKKALLFTLLQKTVTGSHKPLSNKLYSYYFRKQQKWEGVSSLHTLPKVIVILDPKNSKLAIREAQKRLIPVISLVNTDDDLTGITYPIPCNTHSVATTILLMDLVAEQIISTQK